MINNSAQITYLYNSGFTVEIGDQLLIFDYCLMCPKDGCERLTSGVVGKKDIESKTSVIVFVSHGHKDHFNAAILKWGYKYKNVTYVFSDDIPACEKTITMRAGDSISVNNTKISAFPSTDIGVSFLVEIANFSIFHAGDLNLWTPKPNDNESVLKYRQAKFAYMKALKNIHIDDLDIAFFPVDPRIGSKYETGAQYFVQRFKPKLFVPMHFGVNYYACKNISTKIESEQIKVFQIQMRGHQCEYIKQPYI